MPFVFDSDLYSVVGLVGDGYAELLLALTHALAVLIIMLCVKKAPSPFRAALAAALTLGQGFYIWSVSSKSLALLAFCYAALFPAVMAALRPSSLDISDGLFLLNSYFLPYNAFNSSFSTMGMGTWLILILFTLLIFQLFKKGSVKVGLTETYISFVVLSLIAIIIYPLMDRLAFDSAVRRKLGSHVALALAPVLTALVYVAAHFAARRYDRLLISARRLEQSAGTGRIISAFLSASAAFILILPLLFLLIGATSDVLHTVMLFFHLIFFAFQLTFLYLFYRVSYYRATLACLQTAQSSSDRYYRDLNKNLQDMANLRHDIKNLFLTMGGFVERSSDEEMKSFYREKIYPFALNEVESNYQFSRLYEIPDETLRAFFYMKLSQAKSVAASPILDIKLDAGSFFLGFDIIDLTRVLGILLDNAVEECSECSEGAVELRIKNQDSLVSYCIINPIRPDHIVRTEESSKPGHMGRGLKIAHDIIESYPNAELNTVNDGKNFMQVLNITK